MKRDIHDNNIDISTLVDRYMAGETTNEEETTLRQWFRLAGDAVPDEWRPLRAMFSFVDTERDTVAGQRDGRRRERHAATADIMRRLRRPRVWISSAVAAAAVAIAFAVPTFTGGGSHEPHCYAVIDGKVYTNPRIVKEEAIDALQSVSTDDDPFSALGMMQ